MIAVNIMSRASELGERVNTNERMREIILHEGSMTLGELGAVSRHLRMSAKDLIGGNKVRSPHYEETADLDAWISILKGEEK